MSDKGFRVEIPVNIGRRRTPKVARQEPRDAEPDDVPRIARLLALAHKWEGMVRRGETQCAEIAQVTGLTKGRVTQICSLTLLAPDIQEALLDPAPGPLHSHAIRCVLVRTLWDEQRGA